MSTSDTSWPKPASRNLPNQVAETILDRIANGRLKPGTRLPSQRELADTMGVGLAVIREAVKRLETLNVVEASQGSGTIIRPIQWAQLIYDPGLFPLAVQRVGVRNLWEVRQLLETQGIRLAVQRATKDDLEAIRAVLQRADPLPLEFETSQALNREFHLALARATQNTMLESILAPLLDVRVPGADRQFTRDHCQRTWDAHQRIYAAVSSRDLAASEQAILAHFQVGPLLPEEVGTKFAEPAISGAARPPSAKPAPPRRSGLARKAR